MTAQPEHESPLAAALDRVGDRWSFLLVEALLEGPRRFGELAAAVPGIASNVLSQRLKQLEGAGVIVTRPYSKRPLRLEYRLTAPGRELAGVLRLLAHWAARHEPTETPRHVVCGTPLEAVWYCPTCHELVQDEGRGLFVI
ncbi:MAG TPA: helix-turn-helix domain-containing protein [Actinomycetota bacterium]|jgi:DNA-binding HxlR family transcriptional regulator|nr:helix-turn-helix domain-containing protein [Actinomycetota bacterium]